jgi:hypothetical protein
MDYIDFMLWKAGALVFAAFCWGLYCGWKGLELSGRPQQPGQSSADTAEDR